MNHYTVVEDYQFFWGRIGNLDAVNSEKHSFFYHWKDLNLSLFYHMLGRDIHLLL